MLASLGQNFVQYKSGHFKGELYVVNPKEPEVQGIKAFADVNDLPQVDLAILAIAAKYCPEQLNSCKTKAHLLYYFICRIQ